MNATGSCSGMNFRRQLGSAESGLQQMAPASHRSHAPGVLFGLAPALVASRDATVKFVETHLTVAHTS
jgi:hypothetical protein